MKVALAYGQGELMIDLPDERTTVIKPSHVPGLTDEAGAVEHALKNPVGCRPLREWIQPGDRICILFTDLTRATPNERLIPWLLNHLSDIDPGRITLINQLGTHRPNTEAELQKMLTPEVVRRYRVLNHEPENHAALVALGKTRDGTPALINKTFLEAEVKIVTGFIEPHFFAGFSGGPKGIMPGVAGMETVVSNHGALNIGDPNSTFGVTEGNPIWEEIRDIALRAGKSFLLNVSLNEARQITGVFAGDLLKAHKVGCEFVRTSAMQKFSHPFELVISTNSGYPLDQNLYQAVKGMSAGARVLKPGGKLIMACECSEGVPAGSPFEALLHSAASPEEILALLSTPGFQRPEQWQAQLQSLIQRRADVVLYSALPDDVTRKAHLKPCRDITDEVNRFLTAQKNGARIAVLPQGPLTIPYLG